MQVNPKSIETDVLVIGGGIAGCFASIRASELVENVTLLEKATVRRGGSVGPGMDQISPGIGSPILGTPGMSDALNVLSQSTLPSFGDPNIGLMVSLGMYDRVMDFERFGVKIREDDGSFTVVWPKERGTFSVLSVRGADFKTKLGEATHKAHVNVMERTVAVDLLTHSGAVTGAVALNIRSGEVTVIKAKATVLTTGVVGRVYIPPDGLFLTYDSPTNSGDGTAMAYRAGAELVNMEFGYLDYVSCRNGGGCFGLIPEHLPALVNERGERLINSEEDSRNRIELMIREIKEGRGPVYWDCRGLPEVALKILERNISNEYPINPKWYKEWGMDIRKDPVPIQIVPCSYGGGLQIDESFGSSLRGLYAAGDQTPYTSSMAGAAASGHMAAEYAAQYALTEAGEPMVEEGQVQRIIAKINSPIMRKEGLNPLELEEAVRSIATDYVGFERSGTVMEKGLKVLQKMRSEAMPTLHADDYHNLMRCMEVQNILDNIEMHITTSLFRKESRFVKRGNVSFWHHIRLDYPETDPSWEKLIVITKGEYGVKLSTKEIPVLKDSLRKEIEEKARGRGMD